MERRPVPLGRLIELARPEARLIVLATGALLVSSAMTLVYPRVIGWLVDLVQDGGDPSRLDRFALVLIAAFAAQAGFAGLRAWWFTLAGERIVARLRKDLYGAVIGQEISFFDETRTGEITSRLTSDTQVLQNSVTVNLSMALRFTVAVLGGVAAMLWMSPSLTSITLVVVPVVAVGASRFGRWIRKLASAFQDALARATSVADETIGGVRTVRAFATEDAERARYAVAIDESFDLARRQAGAYGVFQGLAGFAGYGTLALVVWYGGRLVVSGDLSVGDLTSYLVYTLSVAFSLGALAGLWGDFARARGASERVFELIDRDRGLETGGGAPVSEVRGALELRDVVFAYPTRPEVRVLDGLTFAVAPGEVVALAGSSGAGKSTIAALLLRYYDPSAGVVEVDGRALTGLDARAWRRHVGIVSQEPTLFATTLRDNVRYGRATATDEEVWAALQAANAEGFVRGFPEGLDTLVGERGVRLSGGQKQRIAIARALLKDPAVLILDEATSALDAENEHLVQEALERLMHGRTTLVIAHRLSTIQRADRVVVLEGGRVVEAGPHAELIHADGPYRRLVERQFAAA